MFALGISDFVLAVDRFHSRTNKRLEALEKQVAKLSENLGDPFRKV